MYVPKAFSTNEREALRELLELSPLVQLVSMTSNGLVASALPMIAIEEGESLVLQGHFARANDHWKRFDSAADSLAILTGPDAYITPNSYPSKAETHKVVPTWNYESVHARGPLTIHDDADWVRDLVSRLSDIHEAESDAPWKVTDAPEDYLDIRLRGIVGVELRIVALDAKAKLSQDKSAEDRVGARQHLEYGSERDRLVAQRMARSEGA